MELGKEMPKTSRETQCVINPNVGTDAAHDIQWASGPWKCDDRCGQRGAMSEIREDLNKKLMQGQQQATSTSSKTPGDDCQILALSHCR